MVSCNKPSDFIVVLLGWPCVATGLGDAEGLRRRGVLPPAPLLAAIDKCLRK